ncbi:MAG: LPS export ABC transporter periplasmic protein LptC [Sediminibacterium sp.]|nr:LPS export ABC transporter periplasmic protein LptC [Sediminibacterium sp.]
MINYRFNGIIFFIIICFIGCENSIENLQKLTKKKSTVEEGLNVQLYFSLGGEPRTILTAPLMFRTQNESGQRITEFTKSLHMDFYLDSQTIQSKVEAKYGNFIEGENKLYLKDSVVTFNLLGDTLWSEDLYWDPDLKKFYTDKNVIVKQHQPLQKIYATGFRSNKDLSDIEMFKVNNSYFIVNNDHFFNSKPSN